MAKTSTKKKDKVDKKEEKNGTVNKTEENDSKVNTVSSGELSSSSSSSISAGGDVQAPAASERVDQAPAASERDEKYIYIFPDRGRVCPRCQAADTQAYATKDNIQYRKCNRAICRHRYSVRGTRVKK